MLLKVPNLFRTHSVPNQKLSNLVTLVVAFQLAAVIVKACTPESIFNLMSVTTEGFHLLALALSVVIALMTSNRNENKGHSETEK